VDGTSSDGNTAAGISPCPKAPAVDPELKLRFDPVIPGYEIISLARQTRSVFLSILGISWFWFFGAVILSVFPSLCKDVLYSNEHVATLFLAIFSVGIGVGAMLCEKLSRRRLELGLVPLGSIGVSVFTAILGFLCMNFPKPDQGFHTATEMLTTGRGLLIIATLFILSVFSGFFTVPLYTMMQEFSPAKHRSRIIAGSGFRYSRRFWDFYV
jgi:MFS family permease